jgi:hypothetical protein
MIRNPTYDPDRPIVPSGRFEADSALSRDRFLKRAY